MIVDTHSQLWTQEALATFPDFMLESYQKMFGEHLTPTMEDTIRDMDEAGVDKAVIVAVDAETTFGFKTPNELVAQAVEKYPDRLIGFAGVDPRKGRLALEELEHAVKELGLRGLKFIPHLNELRTNDPLFYPLYELAQDLGIPVLFHTGTQYHARTRLRYCHPLDLDDVAVDFPRLKIVAAHFGWPWVGDAIALAMRHENLYLNIAGWAPKHYPDELIKYMNGPLKEKVLFGSDFPLVSRKRIVSELRAHKGLKPQVVEKVLSENPLRFLGLA